MSEEPRLPSGARRRVAVVAADAANLTRQRMPLLRMIAAGGHKLHCLVGSAGADAVAALTAIGAEVETFDLGPPQLRAYADRRVFDSVAARLQAWKPYAVLGIGLKPMVATALASRRAAAARIVLVVSALEPLGDAAGERPGLAVRWLLRRAFRSAHAIVVPTDEHRARLRALSVLPDRLTPIVLPGAGVDLVTHEHLPMPPHANGLGFAVLVRPDRSADIADLGEAVDLVRASSLPARFVCCPLPASVDAPRPDVTASSLPEGIELVDPTSDVRAVMARCHVLVQLSDADGLAHEAVEALACGRPVVTIDVAGCRAAIDERVNGVVVPPRDVSALARTIDSFLRRPDQLDWMSRASRRKAERCFDANAISRELLALMGLTEQK